MSTNPQSGTTESFVPDALGALRDGGYTGIKRLPNVTYGGVTFYHLQAADAINWHDELGAMHNGQFIGMTWELRKSALSRAEATKDIALLMSTFKPLN